MRKGRITFLFLVVSVTLVSTTLEAQWRTRWDYEGAKGAEHWSELDPDYSVCNAGKEQSPIDIQNTEKADLPVLRFESKDGPLKYLSLIHI